MSPFMCWEQRGLVSCEAGFQCFSDCKAWGAERLVTAKDEASFDRMEAKYRDMEIAPVMYSNRQLVDGITQARDE